MVSPTASYDQCGAADLPPFGAASAPRGTRSDRIGAGREEGEGEEHAMRWGTGSRQRLRGPPEDPGAPAIILEAEGFQSPPKTSRLLGMASSSSGQPSSADLMSLMVKMMEKHDATAAQNDLLLKTIMGRVDSHDDALTKMARKVEELNDNMDNIELGHLAEGIPEEKIAKMEKDIADRMEAKMEAMMAALEQEMRAKGPPAVPPRAPQATAGTDADTVVIGGVHRDTPKQQILKVWERVVLPKLRQKFDLAGCEAYCPYLLSLVLFCRCSSPRLARQIVAYLRSCSPRTRLNNDEFGLWASPQKTREQKDRARRLMRLASCLQGFFHPGAAATETYKLVCWRSGTVRREGRLSLRRQNQDPRRLVVSENLSDGLLSTSTSTRPSPAKSSAR